MNTAEVYQTQLRKARQQVQEDFEKELDKWQNRAFYTSAGLGLGSLASSATGVGLPVGAAAGLASGAIDLANAGVYGARALYNLAKGNTEKAKELGWEAGLNALFAIPFIGDMGQAGKLGKQVMGADKAAQAVKASNSGLKAAETVAKAAPEAAQVVQRGARTVNRTPGAVRQRPPRPGAPARQPVSVGAGVSPTLKVGRTGSTVGKAAASAGRGAGKAGKSAKAIAGGAVGLGAAGIIAKAVSDTIKKKKSSGDDVPEEIIRPENRVPVGVMHSRLGEWEPGEPSGYAHSIHPRSSSDRHDRFGAAWNQFDIGLQHNARRASYAQKTALPTFENYENNEPDLSSKVKFAVNKYLNSKEGSALKNHLDKVKKSIEL